VDGVVTVELAFTAPILPLVLLGVVDIGGTYFIENAPPTRPAAPRGTS
jgi:hypothetical protein